MPLLTGGPSWPAPLRHQIYLFLYLGHWASTTSPRPTVRPPATKGLCGCSLFAALGGCGVGPACAALSARRRCCRSQTPGAPTAVPWRVVRHGPSPLRAGSWGRRSAAGFEPIEYNCNWRWGLLHQPAPGRHTLVHSGPSCFPNAGQTRYGRVAREKTTCSIAPFGFRS